MDDTLTIDIESSGEATNGIDSLIKKLEQLKVRVNENLKAIGRLNSALKQLGSFSGNLNGGGIKTPTPTTTTQSVTTTADTSSLVEAQVQAQEAIKNTGDEANKTGRHMDRLAQAGKTAGDNLEQGARAGISALSRLGSMANSVFNGIKRVTNFAGKGILTGLTMPFKVFLSTLSSGKAKLSEMASSLDGLAKKIRMTTLALLGARGAFTAIRKAVNAYMQYDTELSKSLQNNWAVLGSLIAPIIERLIALFSTLVSYVATVIKMFTGVDLVARANAKSLKSQADGAGKASKAVKDLSDELGNLQKFDDLNVVDFGKDSGAGAGAGAGAGTGLDPLKIKDVDLSPLQRFIDKIKANDWYGLGMEISRAFNDGLRLIDFDWLEEKARQWGKNMGDLLNGITDGLDWALVGNKIAGGLNTVMGFVNTFFDTYNFDHLGKGLGEGLNGLADKVNWADIGQMFTHKFKMIVDTLYGFVTTVDFGKVGSGIGDALESAFAHIDFGKPFAIIGNAIAGAGKFLEGAVDSIDFGAVAKDFSTKLINGLKEGAKAIQNMNWFEIGDKLANGIKDFIANINWAELAESIFEFLGSALGGLTSFFIGLVGNIVSDVVNGIKNYFAEYIANAGFDEDGQNIIAGIFMGIVDAIKNVGKWIYDHIFKPFIDGFCKAFGINSPSTVMMEQGKFIIEGLFEGVKGVWDLVKGVFTNLKDKIIDVFVGIRDTARNIWGGFKSVIQTISNFVRDTIISPITSLFGTLWDKMKNGARDAWDSIKGIFSKTASFFKDTFTTAWNGVKEVFSAGGNIFEGIKEGVWTAFKDVVNKLRDGFNQVIAIPFKGINKILNAIRNVEVFDFKPFAGLWKENPIGVPQIPPLATGTNKIEKEGIYHLHQGEAVVPKKYNPAVNNKMYTDNNTEMAQRIDTLIDLISNMKQTNIVNIGDDELYNRTTNYVNRQSDVYGTSDW
jgi:predicted PurR-regulated permease PerM